MFPAQTANDSKIPATFPPPQHTIANSVPSSYCPANLSDRPAIPVAKTVKQ